MLKHAPGWIVVSSLAAADIGYRALIPAIVLTTLAVVTVVMRLYSRSRLSRNVEVEDYFVAIALLLSIAMTGLVGGEFAIDTHHVKPKDRAVLLETMMKIVYAQSLLYHLAINMIKASLLIQYRRLFGAISPLTLLATTILMSITAVAFAWGFFGVLFLCTPVDKYWKTQVPGTCLDAESHFWSTAVIGFLLDFAIWILPMPRVGRLRLEGRQRWGLLAVFGLGAFVCVVSILRLVLVHDAAEKGNVTKSGTHALIWSTAEVNVALICVSLFVMKPLLVRFMPKIPLCSKRSQSATDDSKDFRRWITVETLRNTLVLANGSMDPAGLAWKGDEESELGVDVNEARGSMGASELCREGGAWGEDDGGGVQHNHQDHLRREESLT